VTFLGGSPGQGFGSSSDMNAGFAVERSLLSSGTLRLNGNVGYDSDGQGVPSGVLRTTYTSRLTACSNRRSRLPPLHLNSPDLNNLPGPPCRRWSVTSSDRVVLGDRLEMKLGSEYQSIQFMGRVNAFKPFAPPISI